MGIERLSHEDMSWTGHSIHAQQYHMQNMYHGNSIHNYNCPLDPCRNIPLKNTILPVPVLENDDNIHRREAEVREKKERREREEREKKERDRLTIEEREERARQEGRRTAPPPREEPVHNSTYHQQQQQQYEESRRPASTPIGETHYESPYRVSDLYYDSIEAVRDTAPDVRTAAALTMHEAKDLYKMSGVASLLNTRTAVGDALGSTFRPQDNLVVATAIAAASVVATVATHNLAAYRADIYDREREDFAKDMLSIAVDKQHAATVKEHTSFRDYQAAVESAQGYERAAMTTLEQTRDSKVDAAHKLQETAETKYQSAIADIERAQAKETRTYNATVQNLDAQIAKIQNSTMLQEIRTEKQERLDNAQAVYSSRRDEVITRREAALATIDPTTPIAAAQRREVTARFDKDLQVLETQHNKEVSRIEKAFTERESSKMAKYDKNLAALQEQKAQLVATHELSLKTTESRMAGAKTERDTTIEKAQQNIARAQTEFTESATKLSEKVSTRVNELKTDYNVAQRATQKADKVVEGAKAAFEDNGAAVKLRNTLVNQQQKLSEHMVHRLGTEEEKQIVDAYFEDKKKASDAQAEGKVHVSTLSKKDEKEAQQILEKFGNTDLKSIKGIENSIVAMSLLMPKLEQTVKQDAQKLDKATSLVKNLESQRNTFLAKNGGDESKLSETAKKALAKIDANLDKAKSDQRKALNIFDKNKSALETVKAHMALFDKHKDMLVAVGSKKRQKLDKQLSDKPYDKTTARVRGSLLGSIQALDQATGSSRNKFVASERRFQGQVQNVANTVDFAAKTMVRTAQVSIIASKMVVKGGAIALKGVNIFLSKSPVHRAVMDKLSAMAARHPGMMGALSNAKNLMGDAGRVLGKVGGVVGGVAKVAVFVPGQALRMVSAATTLDPVAMEKNLADGATRLAMKGVRYGTKKATNAIKKKAGAKLKAGAQKRRAQIRMGKQKLKDGVRFVGKRAGAALNRRFGQNKIWQTVSSAGKWVGKGFRKIGSSISNLIGKIASKFKALGSAISKLISMITTMLSSIVGALVPVLSSIASVLMYGLLLLVLFILFIAILMSVLDAFFGFLDSIWIDDEIYLQEDPAFVANIGSNYRNVELSIVEFFSVETGWTSNQNYNQKIECNNDPLYYAVFNNSFDWFGLADDGKDINRYEDNTRVINKEAHQAFKSYFDNLQKTANITDLKVKKNFLEMLSSALRGIGNALKTLWNSKGVGTFGDIWEQSVITPMKGVTEDRFHSLVLTYDKVSAQYYIGAKDSNPIASQYEVSNAKDATAMIDAIYTMDPNITKTKVLRYLGVGEYQLSQHEIADKELIDRDNLDNLFWKTHQIEYNEGTTPESILFHPQHSQDPKELGKNTSLLPGDKGYGILNVNCSNYSTIPIKYEKADHKTGDSACGEWRKQTTTVWMQAKSTWQDLDRHTHDTPVSCKYSGSPTYSTATNPLGETEPYISHSTVRCTTLHPGYGFCYWPVDGGMGDNFYIKYFSNGISVHNLSIEPEWHIFTEADGGCPHKKTITEEFKYCMGHAHLKADIYVTVADPPVPQTTIFDMAMTLGDTNGDGKGDSKTYQIGNGIWTWSTDLNIRGLSSPAPETMNTYTEWKDGSLASLAKGKTTEPIEYFAPDTKINNSVLQTKHGRTNANSQQPLIYINTSENNLIYFALYFKQNLLLQKDLISTEQKDLEVRNGSMSAPLSKISIKRAPNGTLYPQA